MLSSSEHFLKYDILQKFAENYDIHLESLKSELHLPHRTIQQYELKNYIKINNLIQMRTFSCLCRLKNYLANSMLNERCDLGIIHVEKKLPKL